MFTFSAWLCLDICFCESEYSRITFDSAHQTCEKPWLQQKILYPISPWLQSVNFDLICQFDTFQKSFLLDPILKMLNYHLIWIDFKEIMHNEMHLIINTRHGSVEEGYYPHELILGYGVCQMKSTLIGVSELTLEKSYQIGLLRIRPLCFWSIR